MKGPPLQTFLCHFLPHNIITTYLPKSKVSCLAPISSSVFALPFPNKFQYHHFTDLLILSCRLRFLYLLRPTRDMKTLVLYCNIVHVQQLLEIPGKF